ncbi:hypothetical protein D3C83_190230 [compost metagenome]
MRGEPIGKADIGEQVPACGRDRRSAPVEALFGQLGGIGPVDDMAREALLRRGERQRHADQTTAEDQEIALVRHGEQP